jgi:hypothetical protein
MTWREAAASLQLLAEERVGKRLRRAQRQAHDEEDAAASAAAAALEER